MLTIEEKRELLSTAREFITRALRGGNTSDKDLRAFAGRLGEPGGAFVTIRVDGELRGCIGYIESPLPLGQVVGEVAAKAATEDPRFVPMTSAEFARATVEVSVLSPLRQVRSIEEIRVGTHGLLLELGRNRGLLLPQVALEYHWDLQTFLENTARKAGLPGTAWEDPRAKIFLFSAEIVHEDSHE